MSSCNTLVSTGCKQVEVFSFPIFCICDDISEPRRDPTPPPTHAHTLPPPQLWSSHCGDPKYSCCHRFTDTVAAIPLCLDLGLGLGVGVRVRGLGFTVRVSELRASISKNICYLSEMDFLKKESRNICLQAEYQLGSAVNTNT